MGHKYSNARNIQILIRLLKEHGIKRVVASPGATDYAFVASIQQDSFFEIYSCIDERSAAYMATGMAAESGEPVAITCTGATSSRNYMPAMTEAFYRHLPVLAITCSRSNTNVGHLIDQVTDRGALPNDIAKIGVYLGPVNNEEDAWNCMIKANQAILELSRNGGGPAHINLCCTADGAIELTTTELPPVRVIHRLCEGDCLPEIKVGKIGIFVGAHEKWSEKLTIAVDKFCEKYNAVVLCDQTSNYKGKYGVMFPIISEQYRDDDVFSELELMIHIGYISSAVMKGKEIWRLNPDGEIRDTFKRMTKVFQMEEYTFFESYVGDFSGSSSVPYYEDWKVRYNKLINSLPELPFSNVWVASKLSKTLPQNSVLHLGIRNSLRSWNYFEVDKSVNSYCNTGGFGIDGGISSLIGASFINSRQLYFGVFGDLLFYYDMNSLGNRHIQPNVRIVVINNGIGQEFKNYTCPTSNIGDDTDIYVAAKGHFANNQGNVIENYASALGFEYLTASSKGEFETVIGRFVSSEIGDRPMLLEVKTDSKDECLAHEIMTTLTPKSKLMKKGKDMISSAPFSNVKSFIKKHIE